jgi:hypothetical protein
MLWVQFRQATALTLRFTPAPSTGRCNYASDWAMLHPANSAVFGYAHARRAHRRDASVLGDVRLPPGVPSCPLSNLNAFRWRSRRVS